jgi:hypothetical protein
MATNHESVPFRQFEVHGTKWNALVTDTGDFAATLDGSPETRVMSDTYYQLQEKAKVIARKRRARISIPFTEVIAGKSRNGTVYGVNMGSGRPMVEWEDGTRGQYSSPGHTVGDVFPRMAPAEAEQAVTLMKAIRDAERAWHVFRTAHRKVGGDYWSLDSAVQQAIDEASRGGDGAHED